MSDVVLIDTSVLCNILDVPDMNQDREKIMRALHEEIRDGSSLLVPLAVIIETGNHIGQRGGGHTRRATAERFKTLVLQTMAGEAPWKPARIPDVQEIRAWVEGFPAQVERDDQKGKGIGLGDISIIAEWRRQRELNPRGRRVRIWTLDRHLMGFDKA